MCDFANILLSGRCNLRCPDCIGRSLASLPDNLRCFPPRGLERFCRLLVRHGVTQLTVTGTNTDPQLHRHEARLVQRLRRLVPGVRLNLHTNGLLALRKIECFNSYDRATISLPSLQPETCLTMTGSARVLPLSRIVRAARIPIKISTLVTQHNLGQIPEIIERCRALGLRRMVLRLRPGDGALGRSLLDGRRPTRWFSGNPVHDLDGLELTIWDFDRSTLRCLNLYSDGTIDTEYRLQQGRAA